MKKIFILLLVFIVIIGFNCKKNPGSDSNITNDGAIVSSNSFDAVTSKLDRGGDLYLYLNSEKIIKSIGDFFSKIIKKVETKIPPQNKDEILNVIKFISSIINDIGFSEISGVGISTIPIENNMNRSKFIVHHEKDKNKGLIWNLLGESGELKELDLLPDDTVIAEFGNFNPGLLWKWIKTKSDSSNIPKVKEAINSVDPILLNSGVDLTKLLSSLSGKCGYFLTLDKEKTNTLPMGGEKILKIPEPSLALIFSVKDSYIFGLLKEKMPFAKYTEEGSAKFLSIPVPKLPVSIAPLIIQEENLLIFASNRTVFEKLNQAKENKNRLISTDVFKKISKDIPKKGAGFKYISKRVFKTIFDIQKKVISLKGTPNLEDKTVMEFFELLQSEFFFYGVLDNGKNGIIYTANHSFGIEKFAIIPVVFVTGVVAAIAIPNLIRALQKGKQTKTLGQMKTLGTTIEMYRTELGYYPNFDSFEEMIKDENFRSIAGNYIPKKDGWENIFYYKLSEDKETYFIGSSGKDGIFNGFDQKGNYSIYNMNGFNKDIIYSNGAFIYSPY